MKSEQSQFQAPVSTKKSLWQLYEILCMSVNLGIDYPNSCNMADRNYNKYHHIAKIDFNEMA